MSIEHSIAIDPRAGIERAPETPEEARRRMEEMERNRRGDEAHPVAHQAALHVESGVVELERMGQENLQPFQDVNSRPAQPPTMAVADPAPDPRLQPLAQGVDAVMRRAAQEGRSSWGWNCQNFTAAMIGVSSLSVSITMAIYNVMRNSSQNPTQPPGDGDGDSDSDQIIRQIVRRWRQLTDQEYWDNLALFVDRRGASCTEGQQILFMNYTIDLSDSAPWIWDSQSDIVDMVDTFYNIYQAAGCKTSAIYRHANTEKYHDMVMPRSIAAVIFRYTLAKILE